MINLRNILKNKSCYSETLDFIIAFFEDNNLSPYNTLNENMTSVTNRINKRKDAVIAIFKNIEKT